MDEMEMSISLKAIKWAWAYTVLFLLILVIYEYINTKALGLSFLLLITQNLVLIVVQYLLKWKLGKDKIKNNIRELRKKLGVRQEDIATTLGGTRQTINAIENEKYSPTLELAMKLAKLLNTTVEELFILDNPKE